MLVPVERSSAVLVMISSKPVSICNRFHARWTNSGKITRSRGLTSDFMVKFHDATQWNKPANTSNVVPAILTIRETSDSDLFVKIGLWWIKTEHGCSKQNKDQTNLAKGGIARFLFARCQQQLAIGCFGCEVRPATPSPHPWESETPITQRVIEPHKSTCQWHLNPSKALRRVHKCKRQQTDRQTDRPRYGEMCRNSRNCL